MEDNHWITVVMHNKKQEFQVLNSTGKISQRVLSRITMLVSVQLNIKQNIVISYVLNMDFTFIFQRAEIANDTKEVNSLVQMEHPDVSSWPIGEYDMPLQKDGYVQNLICM